MSTSKRTNAGGLSSGDSHNVVDTPNPTDMELMLYSDGELGEPRRAEVEAYIARNTSAKKKLSGLRFASELVRERSMGVTLEVDIAASVMSAIEAGADKREGDKRGGGNPIGLLPVRRAMPPGARLPPPPAGRWRW